MADASALSALRISLVGLPGSGKSTVGRQLARRLRLPFVDTDREIEIALGCTIREFFEREGEARFRDIEADVIAALTHQPQGVLATGGGAVLRAENRACLRKQTRVVYLRSSPEELFRRLRHDTQRPLLQVADPLGRLRELFAQRHPLYQEVAHVCVDTGRPSVSALVRGIIEQLGLRDVELPSLSSRTLPLNSQA